MEVFISWSGERSERVAEALRDWLPSVIQSIVPFMSASDIEKGSRWSSDLASHLEAAQFGLICLTPDNLQAPWLLFEAGALSKSIENSRVVPYLYGVSQAQLQGPLAQFQAAVSEKGPTFEVVKAINGAFGERALDGSRLESAFETWWPKLQVALNNIPETAEKAPPPRTDRDILEEILHLSRELSRQSSFESSIGRTARNLLAHGIYTQPADSDADMIAENQRLPRAAGRIRREAFKRQQAELQERREREMLRRIRQRMAQEQPPSETGEHSNGETEKGS